MHMRQTPCFHFFVGSASPASPFFVPRGRMPKRSFHRCPHPRSVRPTSLISLSWRQDESGGPVSPHLAGANQPHRRRTDGTRCSGFPRPRASLRPPSSADGQRGGRGRCRAFLRIRARRRWRDSRAGAAARPASRAESTDGTSRLSPQPPTQVVQEGVEPVNDAEQRARETDRRWSIVRLVVDHELDRRVVLRC